MTVILTGVQRHLNYPTSGSLLVPWRDPTIPQPQVISFLYHPFDIPRVRHAPHDPSALRARSPQQTTRPYSKSHLDGPPHSRRRNSRPAPSPREMSICIQGLGSTVRATPRTPESGSKSSGAASPIGPNDTVRRRISRLGEEECSSIVNNRDEKGRCDVTTATSFSTTTRPRSSSTIKRQTEPGYRRDFACIPGPGRKHLAPSSLDTSTTLTLRGSIASLHSSPYSSRLPHRRHQTTSHKHGPAVAPLPYIRTPPVHPPSYEYPFLPHHAPRQPLEVWVEEVPPGPNSGEGGWVTSVEQTFVTHSRVWSVLRLVVWVTWVSARWDYSRNAKRPGAYDRRGQIQRERWRVAPVQSEPIVAKPIPLFERRISFGYRSRMQRRHVTRHCSPLVQV